MPTNLVVSNHPGSICVPRKVLVALPAMAPTLLAHQGSWDEALFALVPLALFAGLLAVANVRASRKRAPMHEEPDIPDQSG